MAAGGQRGGWDVDECPVADGGEGTLDVILNARGGAPHHVATVGPLGSPVTARFAVLSDPTTAVVEMTEASGLNLVASSERNPERASSYGTGEVILAARAAGASTILIGAGGSATSDGGVGAIEAIEAGGGLGDTQLVVLCDVQTPYERAAAVFGPQKGADEAAVERLTRRLHATAQSLRRDPRGRPWTGCGGGLSGALWAAFDARLVHGASAVLSAVGFDDRASEASLLLTGEGRIDDQSLAGKVTGEIVRRGFRFGVPVHAVVGQNALGHPVPGLCSISEARTLDRVETAVRDLVACTHP